MRRLQLPGTLVISLLAALTTWLTMSSWAGFSEAPGSYLRPLVVGCLIVALTGALLRAARLHPALVLLGQVALVALWLNHRLAPDPSILSWIPTPQSVGDTLDAIARSADTAQAYAAPVPTSVPDFPPMLIVVGTYLAVLVDFLACGLRRVPVAGLPLLAMYTAPVSLLDGGVPWWKFALIATGFLLLLAAEEAGRLAHWGRDLSVEGDGGRWSRATRHSVWPSARKIGATATGLAVVVPIFIPTFTGGILSGTGSGPGSGSGDITITSPMVNLRRDLNRSEDVPLVFVDTDDPRPSYLRIAVLDSFDGNDWEPSDRDVPIEHRVRGDLPNPVGLDPAIDAKEEAYRFAIDEGFESEWLPAPFPAVEVDVAGDWRYDPSTMDFLSAAKGKTTAGLEYGVVGLRLDITDEDLRRAGAIPSELFRRYTAVDRSTPDWVEDLAEQVTAAGTNRAEKAALLQDWFAEPHADEESDPSFTYDLAQTPGGSSLENLTDFLRGERRGYCEQFAASMALMARTLEIPSRVAVGFLKPQVTGRADTWVFSSHDLHAWPELYFEGVGWVLFEPTPSGRAGASAPSYTQGLQPTVVPTDGPSTAAPSPSASPSAQPTRRPLPDEPVPTDELDDSGVPWLRLGLLGLPVLALLGAAPRLARSVVRRRRWASAGTALEQAEAAWAELRDSMLDLRLEWDDRITVRQRAAQIWPLFCRHPGPGEEDLARVIRNNPEAHAALDRIVLLVERARYARTAPDVADVRGDVALCVQALRIGVDRTVRRKADWLPVSLVTGRSRKVGRSESGLAALSEPSLDS